MFLMIWRFASIILVALLQGLAFAHVLERPAKMRYDGPMYAAVQTTLYEEWGPPNVGGVLEPAAIGALIALAFLVRRNRMQARLTVVAATLLLLAFPVVFFWLVQPANAAFASTTPGEVPGDWIAQRNAWETGHAIRFGLQLGALSLVVMSVLLDRGAGGRLK
jgi:hypothetical protein